MKQCKHCGGAKPLSEFYRDEAAKDGLRPECKVCTAARRKAWYHANREREIARVVAWQQANAERYREKQRQYRRARPDRDRAQHLKKKFGLTLAEYQRMLDRQEGGCAICGDPPNERISLHIDHDHGTKEIRGLLCVRCNNALGLFRDNPDLLRRAIRYVRSDARFRSTRTALERRAVRRARKLRAAS